MELLPGIAVTIPTALISSCVNSPPSARLARAGRPHAADAVPWQLLITCLLRSARLVDNNRNVFFLVSAMIFWMISWCAGEPQRRRHRAGPSARLHGRAPNRDAPSSAQAHRPEERRGLHVHRHGDGCRGRVHARVSADKTSLGTGKSSFLESQA